MEHGAPHVRAVFYAALSFKETINSFVKCDGKKFGSHSMTVLYLNQCYNEMYYKGTALYLSCMCYPISSVESTSM